MQLIKACKELLIKSPFYGFFLLSLRKEIVDDNHSVKTAAIGIEGVNFTLYVNNTFWNKLSDVEQISVLTHEIMHICFFHLTEHFKASNHYNMNIAEDCAINQFITGLPKGCITLKSLSEAIGKQLEPKRGSWYYYNEIQEFAKNNPDKCISGDLVGEFTEVDDHTLWPKDISDTEKKIYENQIKYKLKETEETISKQAGTIPGELQSILKELRPKPPVFNWRKYFRRVVGNSITNEIVLTKMRPSKRIPDSSGVRYKRKPKICVVVDTSGSISMDNLNDFFSEINHIYKTGVEVTVLECDTKIQNIFEFKGTQNIKISGRGGTEMSPALQYYNEHKEFSSCVLFTDGYLSTFDLPPSRNLIWIITHNGNKSQKYNGHVIFIP